MDPFVKTLTDQARSLIVVAVGRYANTGDRMMDTALNVVLGTIMGGLLTLFIHLTYNGGWRTLRHYLPHRNKTTIYELDFEPAAVPCVKHSDMSFTYSNNAGRSGFVRWFNKFHGTKLFKHSSPQFVFPDVTAVKKERQERVLKMCLSRCKDHNSYGSSDAALPIWRDRTGHYVYVVSPQYASTANYYSNSPEAIRSVLSHIDSHLNHEEDVQESGSQNLHTAMVSKEFVEWEPCGQVDRRATFDHLFFREKTAYMDLLTRFKERRMYPAHLPIENKLGIILHGPPGTGKTRLIASTANFLGYDVCLVDMSKIRTKTAFSSLLHGDGNEKKRILVLEEFDCVSGILRRDQTPPTEQAQAPLQQPTSLDAVAMMLMASKEKTGNGGDSEWHRTMMDERNAAADKLDLAYILTKLDGLESNEGRIIIATTNHPERIDPALMRPGRLGLKICLSYASREVARDILCMVFQVNEETERSAILTSLATMPDDKWTPAVILQEAIIKNSMSAMIDFLLSNTKED
jgi:DNA replication protein DnaC